MTEEQYLHQMLLMRQEQYIKDIKPIVDRLVWLKSVSAQPPMVVDKSWLLLLDMPDVESGLPTAG